MTLRPTRVHYVLKRFPRLSETFILREILGLEAAGVHVSVDSLLAAEDGPRHPELSQLEASVRYLPRHPRFRSRGVATSHLSLLVRTPIVWIRLARRSSREGRWVRFLHAGLIAARARRAGADVIHAHFATVAAEVARDASALAGVPFTVTCHAKDIFHRDNVPLLAGRVRGAAALVTVSGYNVAYLRAMLPEVPVHLVANPIPIQPPLGWSPDGAFLCVARLVPKKGVDVLIDAVALLAARRPELRTKIVGDGPLRDGLIQRARDAGVSERVQWLGSLTSDRVRRELASSRAFVLACRVDADEDRDGMPTVLVEAMMAGVPVISTDVVGIGELVRDGETGFLVPPDDPAALAAAMERLADQPRTADRFTRAGRDLAVRTFDPEASRERLLAVWASAMGSPSSESLLAQGDERIGGPLTALDGRGKSDVPGQREVGVGLDGLGVMTSRDLGEPSHERVLHGS